MTTTQPILIASAQEEPSNPFTVENLRLDQSFEAGATRKLLTSVPVDKPNKQRFIRTHPAEDYRMIAGLIILKEEGEHYVCAPAVVASLPEEVRQVTLYTVCDRQNNISLWPIPQPDVEGRDLDWWRTARIAAEHAMRKWIRVVANKAVGGYEILEAEGRFPDPIWPELTFMELMAIAFRDRYIGDLNHVVIQKLYGRA
jgi:hypothetical protein